jgi:hypothetical protein
MIAPSRGFLSCFHMQEDEAGQRFYSILVVNDRLQLDQQLGDTVSSFLAGKDALGRVA